MKTKLAAIYTISLVEFEQLEYMIKDDTWIQLVQKNENGDIDSSKRIDELFSEDDDSKSKRAHRVTSLSCNNTFEKASEDQNKKQKEERELSKSNMEFIFLYLMLTKISEFSV